MSYPIPRTEYLSAMFEAGLQAGAAAIMPWELVAWHVQPNASTGFDFGVDDSSFGPVTQMVEELYHRVRLAFHCLHGSAEIMASPSTFVLCLASRVTGVCWSVYKCEYSRSHVLPSRLGAVRQVTRHRSASARLCMRWAFCREVMSAHDAWHRSSDACACRRRTARRGLVRRWRRPASASTFRRPAAR